MKEFGSDKSTYHSYTDIYEEKFLPIKNENIFIFELGLGTNNIDVPSNMGPSGKPGASLRGWREYFPNGMIYGADIDKRILFSEEKIETFYVDQANTIDIENLWNNEVLKNITFDIIIDDGVHQPDPSFIFLEHSIHKLKSGGYYFIEDINVALISYYNDILNGFGKKYNFSHEIINLTNEINTTDNSLAVITKM